MSSLGLTSAAFERSRCTGTSAVPLELNGSVAFPAKLVASAFVSFDAPAASGCGWLESEPPSSMQATATTRHVAPKRLLANKPLRKAMDMFSSPSSALSAGQLRSSLERYRPSPADVHYPRISAPRYGNAAQLKLSPSWVEMAWVRKLLS